MNRHFRLGVSIWRKTEKTAKNSRRECKHYLSFNGILMTYLLGSSLHSVSQYWVLLFSISNVLLDEKSVFFNASIIFNQLEVHIKHVFSNCRTDKSKQFLIICVRQLLLCHSCVIRGQQEHVSLLPSIMVIQNLLAISYFEKGVSNWYIWPLYMPTW